MRYKTRQGRTYEITEDGAAPLFKGGVYTFRFITPDLANWKDELEAADKQLKYSESDEEFR